MCFCFCCVFLLVNAITHVSFLYALPGSFCCLKPGFLFRLQPWCMTIYNLVTLKEFLEAYFVCWQSSLLNENHCLVDGLQIILCLLYVSATPYGTFLYLQRKRICVCMAFPVSNGKSTYPLKRCLRSCRSLRSALISPEMECKKRIGYL